MYKPAKYLVLFFAAAWLYTAPGAASTTKKEKILSLFRFDEPRWQVSMLSNFAFFIDYDNFERNGRGASLFSLFRITRALSVSVEAGYFYFERAGKAPEEYEETENTQTLKLKGLLRYDLDIIEFHPYVALGGSLYFFLTGNLKTIDPLHWGPNIEIGLDFTLAERILFGVVFDWGWILKYAPPPGNDYPTFMQVSIKMGGVI